MNSQSDNTHQPLDEAGLSKKLDNIFDTFNNNDSLEIHLLGGEFECMHLTDEGKKAIFSLFQSQLAAAENDLIWELIHYAEPNSDMQKFLVDKSKKLQSQADTNQSHEGGEEK